MTAYAVFKALAEGRLKLTDPVTISEHAWRTGGSRSFVQVGMQIPVDILIKGMIVQSGNDASIALAEKVGGTEAAFAQMMNEYARRLRSEEHTSELQSQSNLVCRLLLEKKKLSEMRPDLRNAFSSTSFLGPFSTVAYPNCRTITKKLCATLYVVGRDHLVRTARRLLHVT